MPYSGRWLRAGEEGGTLGQEETGMLRFAAIGLDHRHVYDLTAGLLAAGALCVGHDPVTTDPRVLAGFRKRFPDVPAADRDRLLDDPSVDFIVLAAVPRDRAQVAAEALRRG